LPPAGPKAGRDRHRGSDQWLYVVPGTGVGVVNRKRISLRRGMMLVIERSDEHEVKNTGRAALKTINVYVPPAYTKRGGELPRAKP
jgi:mannose-6-phosphate isomerase-like protein (cupin superfamily)